VESVGGHTEAAAGQAVDDLSDSYCPIKDQYEEQDFSDFLVMLLY
jgi:hypothetical protein